MDLTRLFEIQRKLDAEIEEKHPTAAGEDRLAKRILALQVELGECANEWRGFKFWSNDQEPRVEKVTLWKRVPSSVFEDEEYKRVLYKDIPIKTKNPLLEEYVDCVHFTLSLGLEINFTKYNLIGSYQIPETIEEMFLSINEEIAVFSKAKREKPPIQYLHLYYSIIFDALIALGEMLGFAWEQIIEAYMSKNKTNWERQANGY